MNAAGDLTVGNGIIAEMVRLAALEVPGVVRVGRAGPAWRAVLASVLGGPAVSTSVRDARVHVRLWIIARPGHPLPPLVGQVRAPVSAAVERLLGLELAAVTVLVDGIGNPRAAGVAGLRRGPRRASA